MNKGIKLIFTGFVLFVIIVVGTMIFGENYTIVNADKISFRNTIDDSYFEVGDKTFYVDNVKYDGFGTLEACPDDNPQLFTVEMTVSEGGNVGEPVTFKHLDTKQVDIFNVKFQMTDCMYYRQDMDKMYYKNDNWANLFTLDFVDEEAFDVVEVGHAKGNLLKVKIKNDIANFDDAGIWMKIVPQLLEAEQKTYILENIKIDKGQSEFYFLVPNEILGEIEMTIQPYFILHSNKDYKFYTEKVEFSYDYDGSLSEIPDEGGDGGGDEPYVPSPDNVKFSDKIKDWFANLWRKLKEVFE